MTYACSAPERGLSLWDWTVGALHQDRCSVGVYRVGSELFGSLLPIVYQLSDNDLRIVDFTPVRARPPLLRMEI